MRWLSWCMSLRVIPTNVHDESQCETMVSSHLFLKNHEANNIYYLYIFQQQNNMFRPNSPHILYACKFKLDICFNYIIPIYQYIAINVCCHYLSF